MPKFWIKTFVCGRRIERVRSFETFETFEKFLDSEVENSNPAVLKFTVGIYFG